MAHKTKWTKTCNYCGVPGLGWSRQGEDWILLNPDMSRHDCRNKAAIPPGEAPPELPPEELNEILAKAGEKGLPTDGEDPVTAMAEAIKRSKGMREGKGKGQGEGGAPPPPMDCKDAQSVSEHLSEFEAGVESILEGHAESITCCAKSLKAHTKELTRVAERLTGHDAQLIEHGKQLQALQGLQAPLEAVQQLLADLEAKMPRTLRVETPQATRELPAEHFHARFPALLRLAAQRIPALLVGKPGGSKSHSCWQVSRALGLEYREMVLGPTDTGGKVQGFVDAQGRVISTEFRRAWEHGGVLMIEEIDNASPGVLTTLNAAFANGWCSFPDARVERHADFVLVACANTGLRGGDSMYAHRRPLDAATVDRFFRMVWQYDEKLESTLALEINPEAGNWVAYVHKLREYAEKHYPQLVVSPRATYVGARLLAMKEHTWTTEEILDGTVFIGGCDEDTKKAVLGAVGGLKR